MQNPPFPPTLFPLRPAHMHQVLQDPVLEAAHLRRATKELERALDISGVEVPRCGVAEGGTQAVLDDEAGGFGVLDCVEEVAE